MKKTLILALVSVITIKVMSQQSPVFVSNPYPKTITVSGSAEMEIVPDEIFVNILLKEFQKKGDSKKDLEGIRKQFLDACHQAGIADSLISIVSYSGYNNYFDVKKKKKNTDLFASITYQVKFWGNQMMDALVEKLDDDATQNFQIVSTSHSRVIEFRKQLKIKAIQAAKEKGQYLMESIGEKLGEAVTVTEPSEWIPDFAQSSNANAYSQMQVENFSMLADSVGPQPAIDFKKMKLRFEVSVVFAIK